MSELPIWNETPRCPIPKMDMQSILKDATDFAGVKTAIVEEIKRMKNRGITRIGFMSGPIGKTSDFVDDEEGTAMDKSMDAMQYESRTWGLEDEMPIFSSAD